MEDVAFALLAGSLGLALVIGGLAPSWRRSRGRSSRRARSGPAVRRPAAAPIPPPRIERKGPADPARVHVMLGEMALQARDRDNALVHFKRALDLDPSLGLRRTIEKLESPPTLRRVA